MGLYTCTKCIAMAELEDSSFIRLSTFVSGLVVFVVVYFSPKYIPFVDPHPVVSSLLTAALFVITGYFTNYFLFRSQIRFERLERALGTAASPIEATVDRIRSSIDSVAAEQAKQEEKVPWKKEFSPIL